MSILKVLGQTRRSFIQQLVAAGSLFILGSTGAEAETAGENGGCCEGYVIVNGWVLTDKDLRHQQEFSLHDF